MYFKAYFEKKTQFMYILKGGPFYLVYFLKVFFEKRTILSSAFKVYFEKVSISYSEF